MKLVRLYGKPCYPEGYELSFTDKASGRTSELIAVPARRDGDFCRGCFFERECHSSNYLTPVGLMCMTTIFVEKTLKGLSGK